MKAGGDNLNDDYHDTSFRGQRRTILHMPPLPSQLVLVLSATSYYLIFKGVGFFLGDRQSQLLRQLHECRELLSILHGTLVTILSISALNHYSLAVYPGQLPYHADKTVVYSTDSSLPLISTRSELLNCLTALEAGYLSVDLWALFRILSHVAIPVTHNHAHQSKITASSTHLTNNARNVDPRKAAKGSADPTILLIHHIVILAALAILHFFIAVGRDRGVLVIVMLLLLNASNPLGSLRWWIINNTTATTTVETSPSPSKLKLLLDMIYLAVYALVRIFGPYWLLHVWGNQVALLSSSSPHQDTHPPIAQAGLQAAPPNTVVETVSVWTTFFSLRLWCQLGTGLIWFGNAAWWGWGVWRLGRRSVGSRSGSGRVSGGDGGDGEGRVSEKKVKPG